MRLYAGLKIKLISNTCFTGVTMQKYSCNLQAIRCKQIQIQLKAQSKKAMGLGSAEMSEQGEW